MKILIPVDRSRRDAIVLPYASRLAEGLSARSVLVHAVPLTRSLVPGAMREAEAYLTAVQDSLAEKGLAVECIGRRGAAADVIIAVATEVEADLIIMATHGRNGLGKLLLGSVASAVLAHCSKPVLLLSGAVPVESSITGEAARLQAEYVGVVIWQMESKQVLTKKDAEVALTRLATMGLDLGALVASYQAGAGRCDLFSQLDFDFQMDTLHTFFSKEVAAWVREEILQIPNLLAA